MIKNKRGELEFSFAWIFAIVAGMFILFLAIYGVTKFINLEKTSMDAQAATDIGVLTNPLESSFETGKRAMIKTPSETRIYTECSNTTFFGKQIIRTSQKTYNQWSEEIVNVNFPNKYIFANSPVEGKNFYLFSKPFELPFKIADLIYITSTKDKYCFIEAPDSIEEEIKNLKGTGESPNENFFIKTSTTPCPDASINVCFKRFSYCDINVDMLNGYVQKEDNKKMYFDGDSLMYAAIFSNNSKEYECQLDRLMKRTEQLYEIYEDKSQFVTQKIGCDSGLYFDLIPLGTRIKDFQTSSEIPAISLLAEDLDKKNDYAECKLW